MNITYFLSLNLPAIDFKDMWDNLPKNCILKIVDSTKYHLTLNYFGRLDRVDEVIEALRMIDAPSLSIKFTNTGKFPPNGIRVLFIEPEYNLDLISFVSGIRKILKDANLPAERRPYYPHLTLARVKKCSDTKLLLDYWLQKEIKPFELKFNSFTLMKSISDTSGSYYQIVHKFE